MGSRDETAPAGVAPPQLSKKCTIGRERPVAFPEEHSVPLAVEPPIVDGAAWWQLEPCEPEGEGLPDGQRQGPRTKPLTTH